MVLSIIVPVLNGEKYIKNCLLSAMQQEVKDVEILVVDSGSTDTTIEIVEKLRDTDNRIKLIHCINKSYGAQVNLGIRAAKGKYLVILEADDQVPLNAYNVLVNKIGQTNVDIVKGNYKKFVTAADGKLICSVDEIFESTSDMYEKVISAKTYTNILRIDRYLWRGIYRKEFLEKYKIRLNETPGAAFQDNGFLMKTLIYAESIIYIKDCVYLYRKDNENSSVYNPNGLRYIADEYEYIYDFLINGDIQERNIYFPQFYLTLMDLIRTRCLMMGLVENSKGVNQNIIQRLQGLLKKGIEEGYIGQDCRYQKDLYEAALFVRDAYSYMKYTHDEITAEKEDVNRFWNRLLNYSKINVWGYGRTGSMLHILADRRNIAEKFVWSDINYKDTCANIDIYAPDILAKAYDEKDAYVICAEKNRYEIREILHNEYAVPYSNIYFYTLGCNQYLLFM